MIFDNPIFETINENTVNIIAQVLYDNAFGNILTKVSEQLVTNPMDVFKHAKIIVKARIMLPAEPR